MHHQGSWLQKGAQDAKLFLAFIAQNANNKAIKAMLDRNGILQTNYKKIRGFLVGHFSSFLSMKK